MQIVYDAATAVVGFRPQDDFSYSVQETPVVSGGSVTEQSYYDATFNVTTSTGIANNCKLLVNESALIPGHSFINNTPAVASIDGSGSVAHVSNGTALIDVVTPVGTRRLTRTMTNNGTTATTLKEYKTGSLCAHLVAQINALINGKTPGRATQELTTANNNSTSSPTVTRNASLFTGALDLTPLSVIRSGLVDEQYPISLISPRHVAAASHVLSVGSVCVWKNAAGAYQTATVISKAHQDPDIAIGYLSAAITGITPFKVLPSNWVDYFTAALWRGTAQPVHFPVLQKAYWVGSDWQSGMVISEFVTLQNSSTYDTNGYYWTVNSGQDRLYEAAYRPWAEQTFGIRGGDSGSPSFMLINGELVYIAGQFTTGSAGNLAAFDAWIEAQMNALAVAQGDNTAYSLLRADLSGFTVYPTL